MTGWHASGDRSWSLQSQTNPVNPRHIEHMIRKQAIWVMKCSRAACYSSAAHDNLKKKHQVCITPGPRRATPWWRGQEHFLGCIRRRR